MAQDITDKPTVSNPDLYVAIKDGHLVTVTAVDAAGAIDSMDDVPGLTDALNAVTNSVSAVVGAAPSDLNTLEKIADAINNDPSFYTSVAPASQGLGGDSLAAVHSNDDSHSISQISGLQDALDSVDTPDATDEEIIAGTVTNQRTVSPAQIKLGVETFAPLPTAATNTEITTGTDTTSQTVSAAQIKLAVDTFAPSYVTVSSVAGREGDVVLTLDDAADSSASFGRLAVTTAEAGLLRSFPQATFAGRQAGAGTGALTEVTPAQAVAMLPVANSGSAGIMSATAAAKVDSAMAEDVWINRIVFVQGNSSGTTIPATVKTPFFGINEGATTGRGSLKYATTAQVILDCTNSAATLFAYIKYSADGGTTFKLENGSTAASDVATTDAAIAAGLTFAVATGVGDSYVFTPTADMKSAGDALMMRLCLYDTTRTSGTLALKSAAIRIKPNLILGSLSTTAATNTEITAGTETATRTVSPAQMKLAVDTFAPTGAHVASDAEIAAGTLTTTSTVSPKQVKDAVDAFAPVPTSATDEEISAGTETDTRTVSPKQIKDAVVAHTPAPANMANSTIKGRVTSGAGAPEDLTVSQAQSLLALPPDTATRLAFTTYNGIVDTSAQTLSYNVSTKTFTVTRTSDYDVWVGGSKITITATKTVVHADTATTYYIYFDASGSLIASTTKWAYNGSNAPVAVLTYSPSGAVGIWCDCRFPYRRGYHEWEYQDNQVGAWLDNGYAATFGITDGSVSVAAGRHVLNGLAYSTSGATTTVNVLRRRNDLSWNQNSTAGSDIRLVVSSTLNYDSNGTQTNVTLNYYVNVWLFMLGGTLYSIAGQTQYSTQLSAESASVDNVSLPGSIAAAGRLIARVTYQRTSTTPSGVYVSYADLRRSKVIGGVTISSGSGAGGASAAAATDDEVIAGTGTTTRTVSPAQMKLAVTTHTTVPVAATNSEITAGTSTSTRTVSAAQVKLAVDTFAPVQAADTEWRAYDVPLQNSVTKATGLTTNTLFYAQGQSTMARSTINAVGLTQFQLRFMVTSSVATRFGLIECSADGGSTWSLPDGSTVTQAHMAALNPVVLSSSTSYNDASAASSPNAQTYSLAAGLRVAKLMYRPIFYDTATTPTDFVCNRCELLIQGAGITVASSSSAVPTVFGRSGPIVATPGDYSADLITDAADGTKIIPTGEERLLTHFAGRRCLSPFNFIRRVTGLDLTRDFGTNNLTADAAPDGSSGTDDRTKLKAIRDSLRSYKEVELILPRSFAVSQSVNWDLQDTITHIVGRGEYESVMVCTKTTAVGYQNGPLNYGGITNDTLYTQHVWRLAKGRGVSGTPVDNIQAGDDVFVASVTADYDAVNVGDWLCFVGGWYYNNGGSTAYGITRRWTAKVISKLGSGYIKMDRAFPRTFESSTDSTYNSGARIYKDSSGVGIAGNAFARFADMTADNDIVTADNSYAGKMFHSRVNLYGLGIRVNRGFPMQGGLMLDSYWDSVRIESDNYAFYGNAMQDCYLRNITACNRAGFVELGVGSTNVLFEDFVWTFRETAINADSGQGWILRSGEDSWNTVYRRGQLLGRNKLVALSPGGGPGVFQAYVSSGMWIDQIYAELGFDGTIGWGGFTTGSANDGGTLTGRANKATDIYLKFTNSAFAGGGYFQCKGDGGEVRRVKVDGALSGALSAPSINGGDYCTIEDVWVKGNPTASVQNSNRSTVRRYDGSVTDSGTNTKTENNGTGKAALGKFFAGL